MTVKKSESEVQDEGRLIASRKYKCSLFRNNVGSAKTMDGRWIEFGLLEGSGDYIGYRSIVITPEMVGKKIAQIVSLEFKHEGWKMPKKPNSKLEKQINWRDRILEAGGAAGFVSCEEDLDNVLGE